DSNHRGAVERNRGLRHENQLTREPFVIAACVDDPAAALSTAIVDQRPPELNGFPFRVRVGMSNFNPDRGDEEISVGVSARPTLGKNRVGEALDPDSSETWERQRTFYNVRLTRRVLTGRENRAGIIEREYRTPAGREPYRNDRLPVAERRPDRPLP